MRTLFAVLFIALSVGYKSPKLIIEGVIATKNCGKVFLLSNNDTLASTRVKSGKFKIKTEINALSICTITWGDNKNQQAIIFAEGENIKIDVSEMGVTIKGGQYQDEWSKFISEEQNFIVRENEILKEHKKAQAEKNLFATRVIRAQSNNLNEERSKMENDFIKRNDNILGAYIIKRRIREFVSSKKVTEKYELLGENGRKTLIGKELESYYKSDKTMKVGLKAPDFTLQTIDGKELSLYAIKSKIKIIDFWASWCAPCRAANPDVVALYKKYHDKGLEIIGVSLDDNKLKWEEAVKADNLNWIHVSSLKGWNCPIVVKYGIKGVPSVIVVDENNNIIAIKPSKDVLEKILSEKL